MSALYYASPIEKKILLEKDELKHLFSIKKKSGDIIQIVNGKGNLFEGTLSFENKNAYVSFESQRPILSQEKFPFRICIAPTKNTKRIDWLVEKATELGFHTLSFFYSDYSERKIIATDRLKKKSIAAIKQSKQLHLPIIDEIRPLKSLVNTVVKNNSYVDNFVATVALQPKNHLVSLLNKKENCIWIGPEGGFSNREIAFMNEHNIQSCSLGNNVLRTETAGLFALSMMHIQTFGI